MRIGAAELAIRIGGAVVVTAAALVAAAVEAFLSPFRIGAAPVPLAAALAFGLNWGLAAIGVWWVRGRWIVAVTAFAWFAVTVAASMPSAAGSLVITSGLGGYALLFAGTAGIGVSLWQYFRPVRRDAPTPTVRPKESGS